jgi:hypothetical protein
LVLGGVLFGIVGAVGVLGCGAGKRDTVKDPSEEPTAGKEETPKWEGASVVRDEPNAPKKAGGGGGTVNEAPKQRTDQYDKEATESVLKRAARQVKDNCGAAKDESGKAVGPWGKATLQVILGHNGHSKAVTVPAPYQGKPTGNCVEKAFTNLTFPPWSGADTQIDWEVELVQGK